MSKTKRREDWRKQELEACRRLENYYYKMKLEEHNAKASLTHEQEELLRREQ